MKPGGPLPRRTGLTARPACPRCRTTLNPISAKRRAQLPARTEARAEVHARDRVCQAAALVPSVTCWGPLDVDETKARSAGGDWLDPADCKLLCRAHHDWRHAHPAEAHTLGLHRWSWE